MKLDLVYNPGSGRHQPVHIDQLKAAFQAEGFAVNTVLVRFTGTALSDDADLICVCGGDGTLNAVAASLRACHVDTPLCVFPAGTINLLARELRYSANVRHFAARVAKAFHQGRKNWRTSPLFAMGEVPVMTCLSCGPDSAAVALCSPRLKQRFGRFAYVVAALKLLRNWPQQKLQIQGELEDGKAFALSAEAIMVARGRYYAGPFRLSPLARLDSTGVEVLVMSRASRLRAGLFMLALALRIPPSALGLAQRLSARSVRIDGSTLPIQIDGDICEVSDLELKPTGRNILYCA